MYQIGIDGGGTRSRLVVLENGEERFRCESGGINYNSYEEMKIMENLSGALLAAARKGFSVQECAGIGVGAAGISNPKAAPFLKACLNGLGFSCPIVIAGDQEAALAGGIGRKAGILLIAGTGSVCMAQDGRGRRYRAGGYGHIIDDAGSAYAAGRDILNAVLRAEDGRARPTALRERVFERLSVETVNELIAYVYDKERSKKDIAALACVLTDSLIREDEAAGQIAAHAAQELALLVTTALGKIAQSGSGPFPLLLEGGLILKNREINRRFMDLLAEKNAPVYPAQKEHDAAYGAALLL